MMGRMADRDLDRLVYAMHYQALWKGDLDRAERIVRLNPDLFFPQLGADEGGES